MLVQTGRLRIAEQRGKVLSVVIDGNAVGKTPWEAQVAVGEHTVMLRGEGDIGTQPISISVQSHKVVPLTLAAEELAAAIRIEPTPASASVAIDGAVVGHGIWEGRLRAGIHRIEVAAPGFVTEVTTKDLRRGNREVLTSALQRDPSSPFWRKPPRPPRFTLELGEGVSILPSFGGEFPGTCVAQCSQSLGIGSLFVVQGGYELGSGFGFGGTLGAVSVQQTTVGRSTTVTPYGLDGTGPSSVDDLLGLRGVLAGGFTGFSFGESVRFHLRLGMGALIGRVVDIRSGRIKAQHDHVSYPFGPAIEAARHGFLYLAPEVRVGLPLSRHVELSAGTTLFTLISFSPPTWDSDYAINAGADGYGSFSEDALTGKALFLITPGLGARYDF
jgi:PEGA domain